MPSSSSSNSATPTSTPPYAAIALALSEQHWTQLGQGDHPITAATDDFEINVKRVTSLLLVRVVARAMEIAKQTRQEELLKKQQEQQEELLDTNEFSECEFDYKQQQQLLLLQSEQSSFMEESPFPETNWSTTNICTVFLQEQCDWPISETVVRQVEQFVRSILIKYDPKVPYHNASHATHVTISTNKLLDMLWVHRCNSFGLRQNALSLLALVFAAIIHDVEHRGLPNRQLALEDDELAILYNDTSIAEQRSLFIGFQELLKPDYKELRETIFPVSTEYHEFRSKVLSLVLNTDIASPSNVQLAKSKYIEAFQNPSLPSDAALTEDEVEENMLEHVRRMPMNTVKALNKGVQNVSGGVMTVADASVSGVKNVANFGVSGVKKIGEASMDGVSKVFKGVGGVVGVKSTSTADQEAAGGAKLSPKPPKSMVSSMTGGMSAMSKSLKRNSGITKTSENDDDTADSPAASKDMLNQARKYTVDPMKNTVKLVTGSLGSIGNSFGLNKNKKLGIRVSMDLTGETVETYRRTTRRTSLFKDEVDDEVDDLKAAVLMDLIMTAADVSQNLQGYEQMCKWAGRLYIEMRKVCDFV
ncbi:hypothetical protein MPSEU_000407100 [Mayamaea pseudoterrestris]|nr:hypothetical protein MPSEU_000407100 [Mayamaea pseudoterrestris]